VAVIEESKKRGPLEGLTLVDSTVKFTNQIMEEKRRLSDQVEKLTQKIDVMEQTRKGDGVDREKFYEGASWLAQQSVAEGEEALRRLEALRQDFRKRVTETGCSDAFMRERLAEWVLDSSERIVKEAKEKAE